MKAQVKVASSLLLATVVPLGWGCQPPTPESSAALGTPELRGALVDSILVWTADRAAFSPPKNAAWGFDPLEAMAAVREEVVNADTEEALFYALLHLSNARKDRQLSVALVPGGLTLEDEAGLPAWDREDPPNPETAPIRVLPDYGGGQPAYFVADVAQGVEFPGEAPVLGDRIISVNGMSIPAFEKASMDFIRHSSMVGFMWNIGHSIRPNGEILEGNFAEVTHPIPLTSENAGEYHDILMAEAFRYLASVGFEVSG